MTGKLNGNDRSRKITAPGKHRFRFENNFLSVDSSIIKDSLNSATIFEAMGTSSIECQTTESIYFRQQ